MAVFDSIIDDMSKGIIDGFLSTLVDLAGGINLALNFVVALRSYFDYDNESSVTPAGPFIGSHADSPNPNIQLLAHTVKIFKLQSCYLGRWRLIVRLRRRDRARNKIQYDSVLDQLRMRIRDFKCGVRNSMI